jgi:hypothetical protein
MKELMQSLFETSNERIKNPFIGSYIIAFFVYNWRVFFLLIFSNAKIEDKIVVINHEYCNKSAMFWPLGIALFYILILPYINLLFDYVLSFSNSKKVERKNINILNNLKHKKAEAKYEREIADERAGTNEVDNLKNKIDALENENSLKSEELVDSLTRYNEEISSLQSKYDVEHQNKILITKEYNNLNSSTDIIKQIYELFLDESDVADRQIKMFLRKYLNTDEIRQMKGELEDTYSYNILPYRPEVNSLLIKIFAYEYDTRNKNFKITDYGRKFIKDID